MQKPRISKNTLYIVIAVVMALLAAIVAVNYVQTTVARKTQDDRPMVQVAVPLSDLPQGKILESTDLAVRTVPEELVPADVVTADNHAEYEGRMLRAPVRGGAPLSASALVPLNDQFSSLVPQGKVAYTLSVDENNSISGMLAPGDLIDVLFVKSKGDGSTDQNSTKAGTQVFSLLQQIKVLATGNRVGERMTAPDQPQEENQGFSSVTLELDQLQAKRLEIASKAGSLRVLLREAQDRTRDGAPVLSESQLLQSFGGNATSASGSDIEFIIGGRG